MVDERNNRLLLDHERLVLGSRDVDQDGAFHGKAALINEVVVARHLIPMLLVERLASLEIDQGQGSVYARHKVWGSAELIAFVNQRLLG